MKKLIPLLLLILTGCSSVGQAVNIVNPFNFFQTGFYPLIIIAELETNFSSVLIDKTKVKIDDFSANPYEILPEGSIIYVMPTAITQASQKSYDKYYSNMITNYIKMNNFAKTTDDINTADFILRTDIIESPEVWNGKNTSKIHVTIMEQNETPVFYSKVSMYSKSDKNFYYHLSKSARPVKELTLAGFEEIFAKGLPLAFGDENIDD